MKCDMYVSERDGGDMTQEDYENAIQWELDNAVELILQDRKAYSERILNYGSWIEPKCHLHEKYTSACCGCQKEQRAYHAIEDYKDWIKCNQGEKTDEA